MTRSALFCAASAFILTGLADLSLSADAQDAPALVVRGGTLIDGLGGPAIPNAVIIIRGNRIAAAGRTGQVQVPAGAQIIDATGKWITPGIIDAKANWYWEYGEGYLHWGVTSAIVSGTRNDTGIAERDAVAHGIFPGPRLYQGVLSLDGAGPDGKKPDTYVAGAVGKLLHTPEEARAWVRAVVEAGADFVTSGDGSGDPTVYAAAADEAHKLGKSFSQHATGPTTTAGQAALYADVLIHTGNAGVDLAKDHEKWKNFTAIRSDPYSDMDEAKVPGMIKLLLDHHVVIQPDLIAADKGFPKNWARVIREDHDYFDDPNLRAYYPEYMIQRLWENVRMPEDYMTPEQVAIRAKGFKNKGEFLKKFLGAGGHIIVSSDITQSPPGLGVLQDMAIYQEDFGFKPATIIQMATKWTADAYWLKDVGSIEAGKLADLDIVTADPTLDILNLRKVDTVIKDGRVVDRDFHPWFAGAMFENSYDADDTSVVVKGERWAKTLKAATAGMDQANIRAEGEVAPQAQVPDTAIPLTPGIEAIMPHTVLRGSPATTIAINGFNFVMKSQVYFDNTPVPTKVLSKNRIEITIDQNLLGRAGRFDIVVKNPEPVATPQWGNASNKAGLLVPFEFTTAYSHNKF